MIWSGAAANALAEANQFAGGPVPFRSLASGRGCAWFRVVSLGARSTKVS